MSIGPKTTVRRSCADCEVCQGERYTCQSDSGTDVYCAHPSFPQRRIIGDSRWDTPQWCPAEPEIAARADAQIAELQRSITIRDTEIARLETDLELARRDGDRYRHVRMMNPREFSAMWTRTMVTCAQFDELIDAARAGNGGVA